MNVYLPVSFILQWTKNKKDLVRIIELSIEEGALLSDYHETLPYQITYTTNEYISDLADLLFESHEKAQKISAVTVPWFIEQYYQKMDKVFRQNTHLFYKIYEDCLILFYFLLSGNFRAYQQWQKDEHAWVQVPVTEYEESIYQSEANKTYKEKVNVLTAQVDSLKDTVETYLKEESFTKKLKRLYEANPRLQAQYELLDKKVAIIIGNMKEEKSEEVKEKFGLDELKVYSTIKNSNLQLDRFDYVIFSSKMATHTVFNQVKSKIGSRVILTDKMNLDLIFDELLSTIIAQRGLVI